MAGGRIKSPTKKAKTTSKGTKNTQKAEKASAKKAASKLASGTKSVNKAKSGVKKAASKAATPKSSSSSANSSSKKSSSKKSSSKKSSSKKASSKKTSSKKTSSKKSKTTKTEQTANRTSDLASKATEQVSHVAGRDYSGVGTNGSDLLANMVAGLRTNDLDNYISPQMREDYIRDLGQIQGAMDESTNAAYDLQRLQALRDAANAENTSYRNTQNAIAEMRKNLVGSGSSGANVGAANATALQALLGLGQQNTDTTTEGLRNLNSVEKERSAQLAANAVEAINTANSATNDMYGAGTSAYGSDRSYASQGAAEAIGNVHANRDTIEGNIVMNDATNKTNQAVAQLEADAQKYAAKKAQKQTITYKNK